MQRRRSEALEEEPPFRPSRRFAKRPRRDTRRFKPGWFELVLDLLRSYSARTGHALVPAQHREGGFQLGWMVCYLRGRYRHGLVTAERIRKLERFVGWSWDPLQDRFEHGLHLLRQFVRREGHACVSPSHRERGFVLGTWVERQRRLFHRGRLPAPKVRALAAVTGWGWRADVWDLRFSEALASLREFAAREGHVRVPSGYRAAGVRLDRWAILQREAYHSGRLPRSRARALEAVPGWSWEPLEDRFEHGLRYLLRFARRTGHCRVPQRYEESGFALGIWVMQLRQSHRKGRLSAERARRLERLRGWTWNARKGRSAASTRSVG